MNCKCGKHAGPTGLCADCFLGSDTSGGSILMKPTVPTVAGWTLLKGKRELRRYEKDNFIFTNSNPKTFPVYAMCALDGSEDGITILLELHHLAEMLEIGKRQ